MSENAGNDPLELVPSQPSPNPGEGASGMAPPPPSPPPEGTPPPPPPPDPDKPETRQDERTFGLVSHLSLLVCCIGPLAIYFTKGKDSKFIKFHSLQASFFTLFSMACMMPMLGITAWRLVASDGDYMKILPHLGLDTCFSIIFTVYSVYIGLKASRGYLAEYLVFGAIARRMVYGDSQE